MGKEHQKRVLAALMAASIAIPTPVRAASPADFSDFPNNWATNALSYAVSNGLLSGDSGKIRANDTLKRAEMAAILNRLAGAVKGASLTGYTDVPTTAWYYEDMAKAVQMAKDYAPFVRKIEIEVENLDMVKEAVEAGADIIMLDNMDTDTMKEAIRMIGGRAETECSGNVTKENIARLTELGVDYISSGALTHSAPILDISLKNLHAV